MVKKKKKQEDIFAEMEEESKKSVTEAALGELSDLARQQKRFEVGTEDKHVKALMKAVTERKISLSTIDTVRATMNEEYQKIRSTLLPEKMDELGFSSFELSEGGAIEVKDGLSVTVVDAEKLKSTLIRMGYQDSIKNQVVVSFPMEGRKSSKRFVKYINRYYASRDSCTFKEKEDIHAQTLKKLMGILRDEGKAYPESVNVFEYKFTKIS